MKNKKKYLILVSMLLFVLSCSDKSSKTSGASESDQKNTQEKSISLQELPKYTKNAVQTQDAFVSIYNSAKDSIVNIRTKKTVKVNTYNPLEALLFGNSGGQETRESGALGSGFVVSKDGYIVTNNHVIDGADEIFVKFSDGREYKTKLVGTSPEVDIAVLKINPNETFKPLEFANSDEVQIGQWSIAFGNPMGLNDSMTAGIVSAAGRSSLGIEQIENFIQTDAAINQGNSGGPLIDISGRVIGVNTAIYSQSGGSVGLGFAIPSNLVVRVKDSIIATGKFEKPYIGIYLDNLDAQKVKALNLKSSNGIYIAGTVANGPAAQAGLAKNDVVTAVDGKEINVAVTLAKTPNTLQQQQILQQRQQQQQQQYEQQFGR